MIDFVEGTFDIIKTVILVLYGIILFGLWRSAPHYLNKFLLFFNLFKKVLSDSNISKTANEAPTIEGAKLLENK